MRPSDDSKGDDLANVEAEAALLGALLHDSDLCERITDMVGPHDFAEPVHGRLFTAIVRAQSTGRRVTPLTLKPEFERDEGLQALGGIPYLVSLASRLEALLALHEFAEHVAELATRRRARDLLVEALRACEDPLVPLEAIEASAQRASESLTAQAAVANRTLPMADLAAWSRGKPQPKRHVLSGCIPEREVTLLAGAGGTNKSTWGHQLAVCYAAGRDLLGIETASGVALYVTAEDDFDRLEWMHQQICIAVKVEPETLFGKFHIASLRGELNNELATFDSQNRLNPTARFSTIRSTVQRTNADLLILDNVGHFFAGNENDRGQVTAFINLLYSLSITIVLIVHPNKTGDTYSGSTAWLNAVRSQLVLECPDKELDRFARVLKVGKANYAQPGKEFHFRWHNFALWTDDELPADVREEMDEVIAANGENEAFMRCLAACTNNKRAVSHNQGVNYAPTVFAKMPEARGVQKQQFERAFERLLHLGQLELDARLWQDSHRHWKQGIRAVEKPGESCGNPPAATPCGDPRLPLPEIRGNTCGDPRAATPPYTSIRENAAPEAAAPPSEETLP